MLYLNRLSNLLTMKLKNLSSYLLIASSLFLSSCASFMVDSSMSVTPIDAEKGDFTAGATIDRLPVITTESIPDDANYAVGVGFGYSLSNKDYLRINGQFDISDEKYHAITGNLSYWRVLSEVN